MAKKKPNTPRARANTRKKQADQSRTARAQAVRQQQARKERLGRTALVGGVAAAVIVLVGAITLTLMNQDSTGDVADNVPAASNDSGRSVVNDDYGVVLGDADAPTTVTLYEDFQCPICGQFEAQTGEAITQGLEDGTIQVEYRMVSFLDQASDNEYSSRALNAALVVLDTAGPEVFKEFHDGLFADQPAEGGPGPEDDELIDMAVEAGAEENAIRSGIEDKVYEQYIENATDAMSQNDVTGTPTVLIDGEQVDGVQEGAEAVIEAAQGSGA